MGDNDDGEYGEYQYEYCMLKTKNADNNYNVIKVPLNTYMTCDIEFEPQKTTNSNTYTVNIVNSDPCVSHTVFEFDLHQHKHHTLDFEHAFEKAVHKRIYGPPGAQFPKVFLGLSTGYDSGAIHLAMGKMTKGKISKHHPEGDDFVGYAILEETARHILQQRIDFNAIQIKKLAMTWADYRRERVHVNTNTEKHTYTGNWSSGSVQADSASPGRRVYLSGSGADEVFSDYGFNGTKFHGHSSFGGKFPADLGTIFPWESLFGGTMGDFLMKDESILLSFVFFNFVNV